MSDIAIQVENLSKRYRIGRKREARDGQRSLLSKAKEPFRYLADSLHKPGDDEILWALKDVSFEVKQGEVLGVIGRNGAGKSTLLKILSRITEPTGGRAVISGRVGSLLEVGTGFHPELTGRENVYLNGAILGMRKWEIDRQFDEIVDFAEIEKFLDTPVKRYSSGMYVRLAFAVAAHLEPEILLVDEVLAVGDTAFQKKCLGKMGDVANEGRTILFVSHNMAAISQLCKNTIWIEQGSIKEISTSNEAVSRYLLTGTSNSGRVSWIEPSEKPGDNRAHLISMNILDANGNSTSTIERLSSFQVKIVYEVVQIIPNLRVGFQILSPEGMVVLTAPDTDAYEGENKVRSPGRYASICEIPGELLNKGQFVLRVGIDIPGSDVICMVENALQLYIIESQGMSGTFHSHAGIIYKRMPWRIVDLGKI